jgi:TerC family integral membrane protein
MLAIDLGVLNRRARVVSVREALSFTLVLAVLALAFNVLVWYAYDHHWLGLGITVDRIDGVPNDGRLAAVKFFTGYLIELSLSADNVFLMAMIFSHLRIPPQYQHRVLFWGILGALVMRAAMILAGTTLIARYHWILYLFGAFLIFTAIKMLFTREADALERDEVFIMRQLRRVFPTNFAACTSRSPRMAVGCSRRSPWRWSSSRRPISSSRWIPFRPRSPSRPTPFWSLPATSSPSSGCARCTSPLPVRWSASVI